MAEIIDFTTKQKVDPQLTMSTEDIQKLTDEMLQCVVLQQEVKNNLFLMEVMLERISEVDPEMKYPLSCVQQCISILGGYTDRAGPPEAG